MAIDWKRYDELEVKMFGMKNPTKEKLEKEIEKCRKEISKVDREIARSSSKADVFDLDMEKTAVQDRLRVLRKQYKNLNKVM